MTAYFHTTLEYGLTGGICELQLEPRLATWQITRMRISSTWGSPGMVVSIQWVKAAPE